MRDFDYWLAQMRKSINTYSFYVDFDKVYANVEAMKIELNILNSLIGSQNVEKDIRFIFEKYPETLKCIPTLLAVRQNEIYAQDEEGSFLFNFTKPNYTIDEYIIL